MDGLGLIYALVVMVFWGGSAAMDKVMADRLGMKGVWLIMVANIAYMLIFFAGWFMRKNLGMDEKGMKWAIISGALTCFGGMFYYLVFMRSKVAVGATITALYPIVAILLGVVWLKEILTVRQVIGVVVGLIAMFLLAG